MMDNTNDYYDDDLWELDDGNNDRLSTLYEHESSPRTNTNEDNYNLNTTTSDDEHYTLSSLSQAAAAIEQSNIELKELYDQLLLSRSENENVMQSKIKNEVEFNQTLETLEFRITELEIDREREDLIHQLNYLQRIEKVGTKVISTKRTVKKVDQSTSTIDHYHAEMNTGTQSMDDENINSQSEKDYFRYTTEPLALPAGFHFPFFQSSAISETETAVDLLSNEQVATNGGYGPEEINVAKESNVTDDTDNEVLLKQLKQFHVLQQSLIERINLLKSKAATVTTTNPSDIADDVDNMEACKTSDDGNNISENDLEVLFEGLDDELKQEVLYLNNKNQFQEFLNRQNAVNTTDASSLHDELFVYSKGNSIINSRNELEYITRESDYIKDMYIRKEVGYVLRRLINLVSVNEQDSQQEAVDELLQHQPLVNAFDRPKPKFSRRVTCMEDNTNTVRMQLLYHGLWSLRRPRSLFNVPSAATTAADKLKTTHTDTATNTNNLKSKTTDGIKKVDPSVLFFAPQSILPATNTTPTATITEKSNRKTSSTAYATSKDTTTASSTVTVVKSRSTPESPQTTIDTDWSKLVDNVYTNLVNNRLSSSASHRRDSRLKQFTSKSMPSQPSHASTKEDIYDHPQQHVQIKMMSPSSKKDGVDQLVLVSTKSLLRPVPPQQPKPSQSTNRPQSFSSTRREERTQDVFTPQRHATISQGQGQGQKTHDNVNFYHQSSPPLVTGSSAAAAAAVVSNKYDDLHTWRVLNPRRIPLTTPPTTLKYARFKNKYSVRHSKPAGVGNLPRGFRSTRVQDSDLDALYDRVLSQQPVSAVDLE